MTTRVPNLSRANIGHMDPALRKYLLDLENFSINRETQKTTESIRVYCDAQNGNDGNSGLSSSSPKKTIQAVFDLIPFLVQHDVSVNLRGIFSDEAPTLTKFIDGSASIIVDGGEEVTVLESGTTTGGTGKVTNDTSKSWTVNEWYGCYLKITSGPLEGSIRTIQENDATSLTAFSDLATGSGVDYEIVEPATTLDATIAEVLFSVVGCGGTGAVRLQRFKTDNKLVTKTEQNTCSVSLAGVMFKSTSNNHLFARAANTDLQFLNSIEDPNSFASIATTLLDMGLSQRGTGRSIFVDDSKVAWRSSALRRARLYSVVIGLCFNFRFYDGELAIIDSSGSELGLQAISGFLPYFFYEAPVSLLNSTLFMGTGGGTGCYDSSTHGVDVDRSKLLTFELAGTGNTGAGMYVHNNSVVDVDGGTPIITGTVGDFSFDGTTPVAGGWAGGLPATDSTEFSRVS